MHRLFFWGTIILVIFILGAIIDQVFYRIMRLFFEKHTANIIRLWTFCIVVFVLITSYLYSHYVTRLSLEVNKVDIASTRLPQSFDGFKIVHISDFHIDSFDADKDFVDKIVDKVLAEKPDIICFSGDIVTMRSVQLKPYLIPLTRLASSGIPVYTVMGNHDYADYAWGMDEKQREHDRDSLRMMLKECGWQQLDNTNDAIFRGEDSIIVAGVENIGEPPFSVYGDLSKALDGNFSQNAFTILLSHNPTHWRNEVLPKTNIDLMLAGHTHAMQMRFFGWSPARFKYPDYEGLFREGNQYLYVNTGLGCTGFRVRFWVKPEITSITLTSKAS
ncbi:MAG: metallophosphoesterase [Bacteroidales bacterium]|nr:metallophosphoesterase [Bacteroidales bacterium]